jgi:DNA-binding PadR family transcriptional regulator
MVLGELARHGPRHGHQIRRDAEMTNVSRWGGVSVGALYRELRSMEEEGLVEPVRTEQVGRRPARTIYQITAEGHRELGILRKQAFLELQQGPDALGVALMFGGVGAGDELATLLQARRQAITHELEKLQGYHAFLESKGYLSVMDRAVFRRAEIHLGAELAWHDEQEQLLIDAGKGSGGKPAGSKRHKKKAPPSESEEEK